MSEATGKTLNASAKSNAVALNAKLTDNGTSDDETSLSRLKTYYGDLVSARKSAIADYDNILGMRNIVSQDILFAMIGDYYRLKAKAGLKSYTSCLKIINAVSSSGSIDSLIRSLYDLIASYYSASDDTSKALAKSKIDETLATINSLIDDCKGGTGGFLPSDATYDATTNTVKTKYKVNGTSSDSRAYKMIYGKVKQSGMIAQTTALQIKLMSDDTMTATAPYLDMVCVPFTYDEYKPLDIFPINLFWKEGRYASAAYTVENDDATSEAEAKEGKKVYSLIYFNGGRFTGSTEIDYSSIAEGATNTGKIIADSSKNNMLTGTLTASKEVGPLAMTFNLKNDDESSDPASNAITAISDGISVDIKAGTAYESKGDLYLDTDISASKQCSAYTGSLSVTKGLADADGSTSILTMQVICLLTRYSGGKYSLEIYPDADSTSNSTYLDEYSDVGVVIGCSLCQFSGTANFTDTMSSDGAGVQTMLAIGKLSRGLSTMPSSSSAASTIVSDALNSLSSLEGSLSSALGTALASVNLSLSSFSSIESLQSTNDTNYEKEYVYDTETAFTSLKTSISDATSESSVSDYSDLGSTIDAGLDDIESALSTLRLEAIQGFRDIESVRDGAGIAFPDRTGYLTAENTITEAFDMITGTNLTKETYAASGSEIENMPVRMTLASWKTMCGTELSDDSYIYDLLFIVNSLYPAIYSADRSDDCLTDYRGFYAELIAKAYSLRILSGTMISDSYRERIIETKDLYSSTGMQLREDANSEYVNPFITYISDDLSGFDYIDIEELAEDYSDAESSAEKAEVLSSRLSLWEPYVYKAFGSVEDIGSLASAISSALERISGSMTIRDAILGACFYMAVSDTMDALSTSSSLYTTLSSLNSVSQANTYENYVSKYLMLYGNTYIIDSLSIRGLLTTDEEYSSLAASLGDLKG